MSHCRSAYPYLSPLAEDLSAPSRQAKRLYVNSSLVITGRRNRMEKSLETRVFLCMNSHIIVEYQTINQSETIYEWPK